ncbi:hypothetical protein VNO78_22368 [Psophocarpus tetragonolobus]|uniref:Uncharacterized protein n=1 Tax=Psophocarpus tetragonolobus TaxID=3891 RepID=A0AAN9XIX8_PSOTE
MTGSEQRGDRWQAGVVVAFQIGVDHHELLGSDELDQEVNPNDGYNDREQQLQEPIQISRYSMQRQARGQPPLWRCVWQTSFSGPVLVCEEGKELVLGGRGGSRSLSAVPYRGNTSQGSTDVFLQRYIAMAMIVLSRISKLPLTLMILAWGFEGLKLCPTQLDPNTYATIQGIATPQLPRLSSCTISESEASLLTL